MAKTRFRKYGWIGNSIAEEDMAKMYAIKSEKKIPITKQVSDTVKQYLENKHDKAHCGASFLLVHLYFNFNI